MESIFTKPIQVTKVNDTTLDKVKRRVVKFLRFGSNDVQTAPEISPFGIDSNPIKSQIAIYAQTDKTGRPVIIGYINKDQKAGKGEIRIFAKNAQGVQQTYLWLKADGSIEIAGSAKHMVEFEALKTGFDQLVSNFNALVTTFNTHVHPTAAVGPPSPTPTPGTPSSAAIDSAKLNNIKTA